MPVLDPAALGLLVTALVLGLRHGIDWDHIAAISDITSTTGVAEHAEEHHEQDHTREHAHHHAHGGSDELRAHGVTEAGLAPTTAEPAEPWLLTGRRRPLTLGTLYALGHGLMVAVLGALALLLGHALPDWLDPLMARVVGLTLVLLGIWVFVSLYSYLRHGTDFRLRSRWMLVFDVVRHGWRRFQAWLHGHEHVEPMEMSSYGWRTAFGVGMIHGIGAETGTQVLLIAAIGGATSLGLGVPMMIAFIFGLLLSNTIIVVITASGFGASQSRRGLYLVVGVLAGTFSLVVGGAFLLGIENVLPELNRLFG